MDENPVTNAFIEHTRTKLMADYLPKIRQCIETLSEEDIWWRPNEMSNSIGNILLHLCGNIRQWIVHGVAGEKDVRERPLEFTETAPIPKRDLLQQLEQILKEADHILSEFEGDRLLMPRTVQGFEETYFTVIFHVVEHFAQHLGQVTYITKMRKNVDLRYFNL